MLDPHQQTLTITLTEAAKMIGVGRSVIYRLKRAGRLPFPEVPGFPGRYSRERVRLAIEGHLVVRGRQRSS